MGFLDDLNKLIDAGTKVANKSLYDPPRLEVDGIVTETNIPEDMEDWKSPGDLAYPHSDFTRDPGVEEHVIDGNAFEPGGELPSAREDKRLFESGTPENPEFSIDAGANIMPTAQYTINTNPVQILDRNFRRSSVLIQNLSTTLTLSLASNPGAAATGIVVGAQQSVELSYSGDLFAVASGAGLLISIAEFIRMPV